MDPETRIEVIHVASAGGESEYPRWALPEVAVAGRSNAGKSSLLNCLANRRDLARVAKTPGRTQRLHFYSCDGAFALVDLPGYGWARASKADRKIWGRMVEAYLTKRDRLRGLLLLVDVRRDIEDDERMLEDLAIGRGVGLLRVATKVDKLGRTERERRLRALGDRWLPFSAQTGEGRDTLVRALRSIT